MLSYCFVFPICDDSAVKETNRTPLDQREPPKCFFSASSGANPSFIELEKSLNAVFLIQGLEVIVPCQFRSS